MKKIFNYDNDYDEHLEITLTPLIDTVLVLLIVFMISIPATHYFVTINLPHAYNNETHNNNNELCFALDQYGRIFNESLETITEKKVEEIITKELKNNHLLTVVIFADKDSSSGTLIELMDKIYSYGVTHVYCKTEKVSLTSTH